MKGLLASHSRAAGKNEVRLGLRFGCDDDFALRVELGATFCCGDALNTAVVGEFAAVGDVPAFAVRGCVDAGCRYTDKRDQEQEVNQTPH